MSTETAAVILYDPTIPPLEKEDESSHGFKLFKPTKVIDTLGIGTFGIQKGSLVLHAMTMVRRCTVIRGIMHHTEEPQDGILIDGGIVIVDSSGKRDVTAGSIWTLSDSVTSNPDKILKELIMGSSRSLATRVDMIMEGYHQQELANQKRASDNLRKARGDALESRFGTFGRGY